jgi:hypothetical protein
MRGLLLLFLLITTSIASAEEPSDRRDTAWDRSVAAEAAGDLARAEAVLDEAWGHESGNYFVQLRRAHLALLRGFFAQAEDRYAALQATPEGASDPDVAAGLHAARTHTVPSVAASVAAPARATPEVWAGMAGWNLGSTRYLGGAVFAHTPVRVSSEFSLHVAGRYVSYGRQSEASPWAFGQTRARRLNLADAFVGADYQQAWWSAAVSGAYEKLTGSNALMGGGVRGRVGRDYGVLLGGTVLRAAGSQANWQILPLAFYWPLPEVGLRAGARLTFDGRQSASAMAGASLMVGGHALHLDGHLGNERAALNPETYSLLTLSADATLGGTLTLALRLTPTIRLLAQAQGERLKNEGATGAYWSASLGADLAIGSL